MLSGITREVVLELAAEARIPTRDAPIFLDDVARATEIFLTSTTNDVMPVTAVDGNRVGDGRPGPVARKLYDALVARMESATPVVSADAPGEVALTRS
jgi:D-alanine transaminase